MSVKTLKLKDDYSLSRSNTFHIRREKTRLWKDDFKFPSLKETKEEGKAKSHRDARAKTDKPAETGRVRRRVDRPRSCEHAGLLDTTPRLRLPDIAVHCKIANLKQRIFPSEKTILRQYTTLTTANANANVNPVVSTRRRPERERKWTLQGWGDGFQADDGE